MYDPEVLLRALASKSGNSGAVANPQGHELMPPQVPPVEEGFPGGLFGMQPDVSQQFQPPPTQFQPPPPQQQMDPIQLIMMLLGQQQG